MGLKTRLARVEQWIVDHPLVHVGEQKAIEIAREEMTRRLHDHNDIEPRLKAWFEKLHGELSKQVESLQKARDEDSGRRQPVTEALRWIAAIVGGMVIAWFAGRLTK
jgi:hypothetical protein